MLRKHRTQVNKVMRAIVALVFMVSGCGSGSERYDAGSFSIKKMPNAKMSCRQDYVSFVVANEDKSRVGSVDAERKWTPDSGDCNEIKKAMQASEQRGEIFQLHVETGENAETCKVFYKANVGGLVTVNYFLFVVSKDKHSFVYARAAAPDYCWDELKDELIECVNSLEIK